MNKEITVQEMQALADRAAQAGQKRLASMLYTICGAMANHHTRFLASMMVENTKRLVAIQELEKLQIIDDKEKTQ